MLGTRIKEARKYRGRSQKWLSIETNVTQTSVSDWESNNTTPTVTNLATVATVLEVSFEWLATGRGEMVMPVTPPTTEVEALVRAMQALSPAQREVVLRFINDWMTTLKT